MGRSATHFASLLFVALALGPALAHLLELPNKIGLSREEYLTVQQIYRGWALLGIVVAGALVSTLVLTIMVRDRPRAFALALTAFFCIVGAQVVFWAFTFPTNQATENWTVLPDHWTALRARWE
jgi:ABC-type cobalamin transport system permease subunit